MVLLNLKEMPGGDFGDFGIILAKSGLATPTPISNLILATSTSNR